MAVEPLRDVRNHFSDVIDRVEHEHERVTVTRNGRPVAVILSPDDLAELEETLSVLSDPQALTDIREADAAYSAGDVIRGIDAARGVPSAPGAQGFCGAKTQARSGRLATQRFPARPRGQPLQRASALLPRRSRRQDLDR